MPHNIQIDVRQLDNNANTYSMQIFNSLLFWGIRLQCQPPYSVTELTIAIRFNRP